MFLVDNRFMKSASALKFGLSYGATSGVITSLGLLVGLCITTNSKGVIFAGLLTIAFADALSDGLGIHISQKSTNQSKKEINIETFAAIFTKMILGLSFMVPLIFLPIITTVVIDFVWGLAVIIFLSYKIEKHSKRKTISVIVGNVLLTLFVIAGSLAISMIINSYIS